MTRTKKAMGGMSSGPTRSPATGSSMGAGNRTSTGGRGAGNFTSKPSSRLSRAKGGIAKKMKKGK